MRLNRIKLIDLIPLREVEGDEENPFAGGGEDAAAEGGDEGASEEGGEKDAKADTKQKPNVKFDVASVKQYNDNEFTSDTGIIISADRKGLQVMVLPDEVPIFVNFQDVL